MSRRDLTEQELHELQVWSNGPMLPSPRWSDRIGRLIGEVRELRDREATQRHLAGLEQEY